MVIDVKAVGIESFDLLLPYIRKLLDELGEESNEIKEFDISRIHKAWEKSQENIAFVAYTGNSKVAGIMTVVQAFAVYANGNYGIINEMYVEPEYRSHGIGAKLIETAITWGKDKGWSRIDVTAPESFKWKRTQLFYERQSFVFSGPKLKIML